MCPSPGTTGVTLRLLDARHDLLESSRCQVGGRAGRADGPARLAQTDRSVYRTSVHFADTRLEPLWDRVRAGESLTRADGTALFETDDLLGVGRMADHVKSRREGDRVYFVINRHITPTNICVLSCSFCGFARKKGQAGAYEHTIEDMVGMVRDGVREVHIVGGHH